MGRIFLTSDTHFCHDREFLYKPRGFNSIYEMNEAIVKNWNSVVNWDDEVYLLGDVMLNDDEKGMECLSRLNGQIHIIIGNHDTDNRLMKYIYSPNVVSIQSIAHYKYNGYHFYLSHYPTLCGNYDERYSLKRRLINLCGHSHTQNWGQDLDKGLIYHCELDAHNNQPVLIDKIITDMLEWVELKNVQSEE